MKEKEGFLKQTLQALASMRLTLFIFFALATASIIGTLFPHGMSGSEVHHHYHPTMAAIIESLGLHDLYRTTWFRVLLLALCINIVVCSAKRLPKTMKLLNRRDEELSSEKLTRFSHSFQMTTAVPLEDAGGSLSHAVGAEFGPLRKVSESDRYAATAERGRWSVFLVYVVHLSVMMILIGALLGSLLGFKGIMNIVEGNASSTVILSKGHERLELPFAVRCDAFSATFYEMGSPKEYRSDLAILQEGDVVLQRSIRVNHPLTYQGITFYQSTYGTFLDRVEVEITDTDSSKGMVLNMRLREPRTIPGTTTQVQVMDYREDMPMGPVVVMAMLREGEEPTGAWILANEPDFHGNKIYNYRFAIKNMETAQYTGLQVKSDPGVWIVYVGFLAMLIGIIMAYYMSHRKIWVLAEPHPDTPSTTRIVIAGRTNRNPLGFEEEFERLCRTVERQLESNDKKDAIK